LLRPRNEAHIMIVDGVPLSDFYPLVAAATRIPGRRPGKKVSLNTLRRWCEEGLRGGKIRLRVTRIGGQVYTCDRWVAEFLRELNSPQEGPTIASVPRTRAERARASCAARSELESQWGGGGNNA
jgi:hypothetical protein